MEGKTLDPSWKGWLAENIARGCDRNELVGILLGHRFAIGAIRDAMGPEFPAGGRTLDGSWAEWLRANLGRGCDLAELFGILRKEGFSAESVCAAMQGGAPAPASDPDAEHYRAMAEPPLLRRSSVPKLSRVETDLLQIFTIDEFLSRQECDALMRLAGKHLRPSTITLPDSDPYFRTSSTCDLSLLGSVLVDAMDDRICRTLGIRERYAEGSQAQRYDVGQQFKAHTDFFEPGTAEYLEHAAVRGNRTWTFMVYLNEGMEGGGTRFVALDRVFQPRAGRALLWNNLHPDGSPNRETLHAGMPVTQGYKVVVTKWFRARGAGPMFY